MKKAIQKNIFPIAVFLLLSIAVNYMFGYKFKLDRTLIMFFFMNVLFVHKYGKVFVFCLSVIAAVYFPVSWYYGSPNLTIISALLETNVNESVEFLYDIPVIAVMLSLFYLFFVYHLLFKTNVKPMENKKWGLLILSILLLWRPLKLYASDNGYEFVHNVRFTPVEFVADFYSSYNSYFEEREKIQSQISKEPGWNVVSSKQKYKNYILVVGESVRKEYLSAYGFNQDNTPFMSTAPGIVWDGMIAPGANTYTSVVRLLSVNNGTNVEINKNIVSLANESGFDTYWLSNQGRIGEHDTIISSIAYYSKGVIFTKKGGYKDVHVPDTALLPHLKNVLSLESESPKLIVLHLMGSHQNFCQRVDNNVLFDFVNHKMSCYITSIYNTDNLLRNIRQMAEEADVGFSMVYVADHGLAHPSKKKNNLKHNPKLKQGYEVPLFISSSNDDEHRYSKYQRDGHSFINFLSSWIGVESDQLDTEYDFYRDKDDMDIKVNTGNGKLVEFSTLKSDLT